MLSARKVDRVEVLNGEILRVSIARPKWMVGVLAPQLGQYVFLNFPEISRWEWHPYTLASSPLEEHYEVDIKGLGDHTKKLLAACTGGWDWAPYSLDTLDGARVFTKGIWKDVYLASSAAATPSITHVVPQISYLGKYPTARLADGEHGGFRLAVRVFLSSHSATRAA